MKTTKTTFTTLKSLLVIVLAAIIMSSCTTKAQEEQDKPIEVPKVSIHEAVFMNNLEAIDGHIAAGSDLNKLDDYGSGPLNVAATFDRTEAALRLIKGGADLNAKSGDGSTPLHTAAFFGRTEIVEALLKAGVDTSLRNNYGSTALESVMAPFDQVKMIYDQLSRDLGPFGLKLDYDKLEASRPVIAEMITNNTKL